MTPVRRHLLVTLAVATVVVTACGGDDEDGDAAPTTTSAVPTSSAPAEPTGASSGNGGDTDDDGGPDAPPFPADTGPDTEDASEDALLSVTDIRIGRHDGFDRVVFEAEGSGTPGWDVRYVESAQSQGSGADIDVDGGAVLQVTVSGVGYPADTGVEEYAGPDRLAVGDTEVVSEVVWDSTFEGTSVAFVGATEELPFRVYLLEDPARVVVEVADPL